MQYSYEKLDDERFQSLCQALLVRGLGNHVQCMPLSQPDGGRDASLRVARERGSAEEKIFQIKFVRNPSSLKDVNKWLVEVLKKEAPKVSKLIKGGAKEYYLITNLAGTSHLKTGSIDLVSSILKDNIECPSFVWWKDDLDRRLDNAYDLRCLYPELLTGNDMLRMIAEASQLPNTVLVSDIIRQYVKAQSDEDVEVKFKQIELHNQLFDLFVDVPLVFRGHKRWLATDRLRNRNAAYSGGDDFVSHVHASPETIASYGAASILLQPELPQELQSVVIEGAPGQGKSTLVQFICQVYRMKLLNDPNFHTLPEHHRPAHVKVPFKIDLRDLAMWLNKQNPFVTEDDVVPVDWVKSVDSFLAAQVSHYAGGATFSVNDLHQFLKVTAAILVFDGLDEVADITRRKSVVEAISTSVSRLATIAASIQVIVTTRPTTYTDAVNFSEKDFSFVQLDALSKPLINEYAEKWIKARRLTGSSASDVRKILRQKIEQEYLRDLSRNPMQLAILISLINTRGTSLPDKRTSLYDTYVELFFNRESEKSDVVRENRDLLIDLHR